MKTPYSQETARLIMATTQRVADDLARAEAAKAGLLANKPAEPSAIVRKDS